MQPVLIGEPKILLTLDDAVHIATWRAVLPQVGLTKFMFAPEAVEVAVTSVFGDPAALWRGVQQDLLVSFKLR